MSSDRTAPLRRSTRIPDGPSRRTRPCISRGITRGYEPRAHLQAVQDVTAFLETAFGFKVKP